MISDSLLPSIEANRPREEIRWLVEVLKALAALRISVAAPKK
jgi:hypothetical protein